MAVVTTCQIALPLTILALIVCAIALWVIAKNHAHNLTHVGGGLKPEIMQTNWSIVKWSGISAAIGGGLVCITVCTAFTPCIELDK